MAWNESGKDDKTNNPWGGNKGNDKGPPDLERALREALKKLFNLFTGTNNAAASQQGGLNNKIPPFALKGRLAGISIIAAIVLIFWLLLGIFIVEPAEKAVVLRFGKYVETVGPGPHWLPRLIETAVIVNEQQISNYSYDAQMLTKDENIVFVSLAVQYRINNAKDFLFSVVNPRESLQQATASALRQVIGHTPLDAVLTSGRERIRQEVKEQLEKTLQRYDSGLLVTDVAMQPAKAPEEVKEAFDDAIKAQEDEQRFVNQAQAYAMQVEPTAKGQAQRLLADANAYKQQVLLQAQGDTARFLALLPQYQRFPQLMRDRLYFDTLEAVLANNHKVILDVPTGNNAMIYLPLEQWFKTMQPKGTGTGDEQLARSTVLPPLRNSTENGGKNSNDNYHFERGGY